MTVREHRLTLRAGWAPGGRPCRLLARPGGASGLKLLIVRAPLKSDASAPESAAADKDRPVP